MGKISIHASREGSDLSRLRRNHDRGNFNPRFPRGKRPVIVYKLNRFSRFQSTLPAREATHRPALFLHRSRYFNPRFPRGKRRGYIILFDLPLDISIHASREGSDYWRPKIRDGKDYFNPRFPRGKRPRRLPPSRMDLTDFNPRFPRGKRQLRQSF